MHVYPQDTARISTETTPSMQFYKKAQRQSFALQASNGIALQSYRLQLAALPPLKKYLFFVQYHKNFHLH